MKSFLRAIFLVLAFVVVLGATDTASAQILLPPGSKVPTLADFAKTPGIFNFKGEKYDPVAGSKANFTGGGQYYVSDGKGMILVYDLGKDGVFEQLATGNQDDFLINAWTVLPDGQIKGHAPSKDIQSSNVKEEEFINSVAAQEKINYDATKYPNYFKSILTESNLGYGYKNGQSPVQNLNDRRTIDDQIRLLEKERDGYDPESDEYKALQVKIDALRKNVKTVDQNDAQAHANIAAAIEKAGVSGVGFPSCGRMFSEALVPGGSDGSEEMGNCVAAIANFFVEAFSYLLILAAYLFDAMLQFTIVDFAKYAAKDGKLYDAINIVWTLIKNICNLIFIGTILYIAIKTIIDGDGFGDKRLLGKVIIMAFLINFSLLFTKLAIDASNIATLEIYKGITSAQSAELSRAVSNTGKAADIVGVSKANQEGGSLAAAYLNNMLITRVYDGTGNSISWDTIITNGMLAIVFILVATFVFLAASMMFLMRFFKLILLMMTSPIAFAGAIFPNAKAQGYGAAWWTALRENVVFAPVFMIMAYISLQMLAATKGILGGNDKVSLVITYSFTIISMGACLVGAKMAGGHAGSAEWGEKLARKAIGGSTFGLAARVGRRTVGGVADRVSQNQAFQRFAGRSKVGEVLLKGTRGVANSTFDVRNTNLGKSLTGNLAVGEAIKGGARERLDASAKEKQDFANTLSRDGRRAYGQRLQDFSTSLPVIGGTPRSNTIVSARLDTERLTQEITGWEQTITNIRQEIADNERRINQIRQANGGNDPAVGAPDYAEFVQRRNDVTASEDRIGQILTRDAQGRPATATPGSLRAQILANRVLITQNEEIINSRGNRGV